MGGVGDIFFPLNEVREALGGVAETILAWFLSNHCLCISQNQTLHPSSLEEPFSLISPYST